MDEYAGLETPVSTTLLAQHVRDQGLRKPGRRAQGLVRLACAAWALYAGVALAANPDFSNVSDILGGQRQIVRVDDLVVTGSFLTPEGCPMNQQDCDAVDICTLQTPAFVLQTSNSQVSNTQTVPFPQDGPTPWSPGFNQGTTTTTNLGRMFSLPNDVIATIASTQAIACDSLPVLSISVLDPHTGASSFGPVPFISQAGADVSFAALADFTGDGFTDLVVSVNATPTSGGQLLVGTAINATDVTAGLGWGQPLSIPQFLAMATGDVDGDGHLEILGVYWTSSPSPDLVLAIYTVDPQTLAVTLANTIDLSGPIGRYLTVPIQSPSDVSNVTLVAGKFVSSQVSSQKQLPKDVPVVWMNVIPQGVGVIATPVSFPDSGFNGTVELSTTILRASIPFASPLIVKSGRLSWFGSQTEQLVMGAHPIPNPGNTDGILVLTVDDQFNVNVASSVSATASLADCLVDLALGNFSGLSSPNLEIAAMLQSGCTTPALGSPYINIFNVDDQLNPTLISTYQGLSSLQPGSPVRLTLAAGDTQGHSLVVGAGTKVTITKHTQPSTVLGMPPMHVDWVPPIGSSTPVALNLSVVPDGFQAEYQTQVTNTTQSSFTNTTSYSFSTTISVGESVSFGIPSIASFSESFKDTWAQAYSGFIANKYNTYEGVSFDASTRTGFSDHLWYTADTFNVYIYPVIGFAACPVTQPDCETSEMLPLNIMFSGPDMISNYDVDAAKVEWYQPVHEPGNVLSYPWDEPHLVALFDGFSPLTEAPPSFWFTDTSTQSQFATWTQGGGSDQTSGSTQTHSFSKSFSVSSGSTFSFDYNSSNSVSTLYTASQTVGASTGVGVKKPGTFLNPANYQYAVQTFVFGQSDPVGTVQQISLTTDIQSTGTLRTAFVANPTDTLAGGWWAQTYTVPDVALNHPVRWSVTSQTSSSPAANCLRFNPASTTVDCATFNAPDLTDLPTSEFYWMRGLFITPASAQGQGPQTTFVTAGDALLLEARVYNYSLADMAADTKVRVRFYGQRWDHTTADFSGDAFLIGEQVANPIPGFNSPSAGSGYNWQLVSTTFDTAAYADTYLVFWVVVWMEDGSGNLVPEMADHGLTGIPGSLTSLADVPIEAHSNNVGFYNQPVFVAPAGSAQAQSPAPAHGNMRIPRAHVAPRLVAPGEKAVVAATLRSRRDAVRGVQVVFYDGDPQQGGKVFDVDFVPHLRANDTYVVRVPFRPTACGRHDIFVVADAGGTAVATEKAHVRVVCR